MQKVLVNKAVKLQIKIPNGCWENFRRLLFCAAPCIHNRLFDSCCINNIFKMTWVMMPDNDELKQIW